jgi:hypothetical protein
MLTYLKIERRDFHPVFDVQVSDISDQSKMALKVDIKYKSVSTMQPARLMNRPG